MAELSLEQWDAAVTSLREALEIYTDLGDREMIGRSYADLTDVLFLAGRLPAATETAQRGLDCLKGVANPDRVRLLAALGLVRGAAGSRAPAYEALEEGLNIARQLLDPKLEAGVLSARSTVNSLFFRLREASADGLLSEQVGGSKTPLWQRVLQLRVLHQTQLYLGQPEEALRIANELEPLALKIGDSFSVARCHSTRAWAEFGRAPDLAKLEAGLQHVSRFSQSAQSSFWEAVFKTQLGLLDFFRGNWAGALSLAQAACRSEAGSAVEGIGVGTLFRLMAYEGDRDGALAILREKHAWLPVSGQHNAAGSWLTLALVVDGLVMLGEQAQAGRFYPLVRELIDTGAVALWPISRLTHTIAGVAAASARQWEAAEEHFRIAMQQAESFPQRLEQAEIRRFHAMVLRDRAARGDREKAQTLLGEALETYLHIGMPRHIEMTQALAKDLAD